MTSDLFSHAPAFPDTPLSDDELRIARAMAILWSFHSRSKLSNFLQLSWTLRGDRRPYTADNIKEIQAGLIRRKLMLEYPERLGYFRLAAPLRNELYRKILREENW